MSLNVNPVDTTQAAPTVLRLGQEKKEGEETKQTKKGKVYGTLKEMLEWVGWGVVIFWGTASLKEMHFPTKQATNEALIQIFDVDGNGQLSKDEIEKTKSLIRKPGGKNENQ